MSMKTFYPVRREHNESLDAAVIGANIEGLLCALSLSQLDAVTVKVFEVADDLKTQQKVTLSLNAQNAIYAISPALYKSISEGASPSSIGGTQAKAVRSGSQRISNSGEPLYTPAARGIYTPLEVDGDVLLSLCLRSLPRGTLEFSHELIGLQEDRDGMALSFQGRPPVRTKMVIGTDASSPAFAKVLQGSSPWGRGRVAQLCSESAPPLGTCNSPQALGLSIEGVVELTYSLSEHGLMPAAIRSYVAAMSDRIASLNMQQSGAEPNFSQKAFPPIAQPDALKSAASPPLGSSPPISFGIPAALKMQDLRPLEPPRGLWNHAAAT
ncbi:g2017 [Coccomyxa elongata]